MPFAPDARFGPYTVTSRIGSGGMGDVYRAWDTRLERHVALKLLNQDRADDDRAMARFRKEAKAVAASAHPNIVAIYDAELEHPPFYLVTELLEGETLRRTVQRSVVPWRRAMEIGSAVANGLANAHDAGVIHRDIKPENIFLTGNGVVKILDFGLAQFKVGPAGSGVSTLSDANMVLGTVGYMAPEQIRCEDVTPATDLFSLACVLFELVTGRRTFQRATPGLTLMAILNEEAPLHGWPDDLPSDLLRWLNRCLEKDPRRRPQSAHDLALLLQDLSGETPSDRSIPEIQRKSAIQAVAVLPFTTSSNSPDAEYVADGITESLINNLAQLGHLRVVARSAVFRHKGKEIDPIQVGRDLKVDAVLTGKVFQRGEILVIGAELANVRDGSQIWGQQYKRQLTDIFALEDELSREISQRLRTELTPAEQGQSQRRYTENPEAYRTYLRGRHAWNKRTIEGMRQARRFFEQAIEIDPSYARAHTGLADCILMLAIYGDLDSRHAQTRAKAAQEMALNIDNSLGEALASVGFRLLLFEWKFSEAERAFRGAIDLSPGYASAHQWLGFVLGMTGRVEEARRSLKIAQELDPFSASINTSAIWPLLWTRRVNEAVEGFRAAVELHPGYWVAHQYLAMAYVLQRDWTNAALSARQADELGDTPWKFAGTGFVYAKAGLTAEARQILKKLDEASTTPVTPFYAAAVHAGLGEYEDAIRLLKRAVAERHWNVAWLGVDIYWDDLRSSPEFQRIQAEAMGQSYAS